MEEEDLGKDGRSGLWGAVGRCGGSGRAYKEIGEVLQTSVGTFDLCLIPSSRTRTTTQHTSECPTWSRPHRTGGLGLGAGGGKGLLALVPLKVKPFSNPFQTLFKPFSNPFQLLPDPSRRRKQKGRQFLFHQSVSVLMTLTFRLIQVVLVSDSHIHTSRGVLASTGPPPP